MVVFAGFNFAYDIVRNFGTLSNEALVSAIRTGVARERIRAEQAGLPVTGIQFDFDCHTRRLTRYADLLKHLRQNLKTPGTAFSITALPTWFPDAGIKAVLDAVDFTVPQYYEGEVPKTRGHFTPISQRHSLQRRLDRMIDWGTPYYAGLPAYGHTLVYDEKGNLVGLYEELGITEIMRHPAFTLFRAYPASSQRQPGKAPDTNRSIQIGTKHGCKRPPTENCVPRNPAFLTRKDARFAVRLVRFPTKSRSDNRPERLYLRRRLILLSSQNER